MISRKVFPSIEIEFDLKYLLQKSNIQNDTASYRELVIALKNIANFIRPRAVIKRCSVEITGPDTLMFDGKKTYSHLLVEKLKSQPSVVFAVITAGDEIDFIPNIKTKEVSNTIKYATLEGARRFIDCYVQTHYHYEYIARMNPGSLPNWPRKENRFLFNMIGNVFEDIGVELTENDFMTPAYTVSEILFDEINFENCELCKKTDCSGRKKAFCQLEYDRVFKQQTT